MNVLVTGAAGFAGRYLLEYLSERDDGSALYALVRDPPIECQGESSIHRLQADLGDADATVRAVLAAEPDVIYHLAGHASATGDAREVFRSNVDATMNLLAAAGRLRRPVQVMLASSGYVYGACAPDEPATEEMPLRPIGAYAESKAEMERRALVGDWGEGVAIIIARAFNHSGPRQMAAFAVPAFARQLAAIEAGLAEPVLRVGNLASERDIGDVRDVVRAYALLTAVGTHGEVFNVCTGRLVGMNDVLARLVSLCRVPVKVMPDPDRMRPLDLPVSFGSPCKLKARTGWRAKISLARTLSDTLEWWRRHLGEEK
jgi:GDP-4-dehydro-6-deoxy-D-mannose reductase